MQTRPLGWTGIELSTIGFGTWASGGGGWQFSWGPQDDRESIEAMLYAVEHGINWIDTAAVYGLGHAEEVVGRALKEMRARPFVATKCARLWDEHGTLGGNLHRDSIIRECEASLRRLGIDCIDLYQIHWPVPDEDVEEGWGAVAELIAAGKVRYGGVSNFSADQIRRCMQIHPVASLQPPYSMLKRDIEAGLLPFCAENNIGVICYSPMQKGLLTGKYTRESVAKLPQDDHRRRDPMFNEPRISAVDTLVEGMRTVAARHGGTPAQLAIAWVLRRPEVTAAIVGARRPSQIWETIKAGDWRLSDGDILDLDRLLAEYDETVRASAG